MHCMDTPIHPMSCTQNSQTRSQQQDDFLCVYSIVLILEDDSNVMKKNQIWIYALLGGTTDVRVIIKNHNILI